MAGDLNVPGPLVPDSEHPRALAQLEPGDSHEAELLYVIATDHAALLSSVLTVLRECRGILQSIADKADG